MRGEQKARKNRKRMREDSSDSSEDETTDLRREVMKMSANVSKILAVKGQMNWPVGLCSLLQETFKCAICSSPIQPPAIFARCCRTILGCQTCVDRWYRGEPGAERKCPLCRCDRGLADVSKIVGLDDFLREVSGLVNHRFHIPSPRDNNSTSN